MIDDGETGVFAFGRGLQRREFDIPDVSQWGAGIDEIQQAAADAADRRNVELLRPHLLSEWRVAQLLGAVECGSSAPNLETDGTD